jgi:2-polyprenyl-3-methyl-5-hydroxy-6-metoxy-1,4-benzoquinol methylase
LSREVVEFVLAELPSPPASVLEVGCGNGELARALAAAGHSVLAIDPEAPEGPLFRRTTIEDLDQTGPFDAAVASRSLHHVSDLTRALEKIAALLRDGGVLIVDDFAWERLDADSAQWLGIDLAEWREEHDDLHASDAMLAGLDARFTGRAVSRGPYLYREAHQAVDEGRERELIEAGRIRAIGFRYVGIR